jgi:catechol 2,3-dioxygenase-like lactoylglutathione lyase family enzyme
MLTTRPITPILPVTNLERARKFYEERLGLHTAKEAPPPDAILFEAGRGTKLELLKRDQPTKAEHTALTFEVDDIEREVKDLESRGVRFEDYDMPGLKTEKHVARVNGERAAWFKDTEGNILCIHQR